MSAQPAYNFNTASSYQRSIPSRTPRITVVPGQGQKAEEGLSPNIILLSKIAAVVIIVFALLGFARVALASASVTTALSSDAMAAEIESVRAEGNSLEVQQTHLSNPTHIKEVASTNLKMGEAATTLDLRLPKDVVTLDGQGKLSLSASIQAASGS